MSRLSKPKRLTRVYVITFTASHQEIPSCMITPNAFFRRSQAVTAKKAHFATRRGEELYRIRTFSLVGSQR